MMGHEVKCSICVPLLKPRPFAEWEEVGFDMPPPPDGLCRMCRKAVKDATEQRGYLEHLQVKSRLERV